MALLERAKTFFENLNSSNEGLNELQRFDRILHFKIDNENLYVNIEDGRCEVASSPKIGLKAVTFYTDQDTFIRLITGKCRFTDTYSGQRSRSAGEDKGVLRVQESPTGGIGGTLGGTLVVWTGKLVRMAQEVR